MKNKTEKTIIETALISSLIAMSCTGLTGNKKLHLASALTFVCLIFYHYLSNKPFHKRMFDILKHKWSGRSPVTE